MASGRPEEDGDQGVLLQNVEVVQDEDSRWVRCRQFVNIEGGLPTYRLYLAKKWSPENFRPGKK